MAPTRIGRSSGLSSLRAPVGMHIGAANPMKIALSILADIVRVQRQGAA